MLVQACPTFAKGLNEHLAEYGGDLPYVAAGAFAQHLLELQMEAKTSCFAEVGSMIERLHTEGTSEVKEWATIGVLEGIQNVWGHSSVNPNEFLKYLGPVSQSWWQGLDNFWSGKAPLVVRDS